MNTFPVSLEVCVNGRSLWAHFLTVCPPPPLKLYDLLHKTVMGFETREEATDTYEGKEGRPNNDQGRPVFKITK